MFRYLLILASCFSYRRVTYKKVCKMKPDLFMETLHDVPILDWFFKWLFTSVFSFHEFWWLREFITPVELTFKAIHLGLLKSNATQLNRNMSKVIKRFKQSLKSLKMTSEVWDNFWQLKALWKWWKMLFLSPQKLFLYWRFKTKLQITCFYLIYAHIKCFKEQKKFWN